MTRIEQDGKAYEPTGERRPPMAGEYFLSENCEQNYITVAAWNFLKPKLIYREVAEPLIDSDTMEVAAEDNEAILSGIASKIPDEVRQRLHSMIDIAKEIEDYSHEIAGYVTESFTDSEGQAWAKGPSAVSHAAKEFMQRLWREIRGGSVTEPSPEAGVEGSASREFSPVSSQDTRGGSIEAVKAIFDKHTKYYRENPKIDALSNGGFITTLLANLWNEVGWEIDRCESAELAKLREEKALLEADNHRLRLGDMSVVDYGRLIDWIKDEKTRKPPSMAFTAGALRTAAMAVADSEIFVVINTQRKENEAADARIKELEVEVARKDAEIERLKGELTEANLEIERLHDSGAV